jgi:hypothetical protein
MYGIDLGSKNYRCVGLNTPDLAKKFVVASLGDTTIAKHNVEPVSRQQFQSG